MAESETGKSAAVWNLSPKIAPVLILGMTAFMFLLNDLIGWSNGGGLFSVAAALRAASEHKPTIDVDGAGLRTLFVLLCSIAVVVPAAAVRPRMGKGPASPLIILACIGGAYVCDGVWDERIVGRYLAAHGYSRCESGDFRVGEGKGSVWMDDYVRDPARCPAARRA